MRSYISPKAIKGLPSKIHGRGLFAVRPIKKNEIVAIKRGKRLSKRQFKKAGLYGHPELQIEEGVYIAPGSEAEFDDSMIFINHSCNPNVGMGDAVTFVAMRNIKTDEELTIDYAMIDDNEDGTMICQCKARNCRNIITGKDWTRTKLRTKYKEYFSPFIKSKLM
ncbi:MAG: SET domain-containing protein-lysine N-methyltransferase [Patescibacteria group bacterium]